MSNVYVTEPRTEGKVLFRTSAGDIDIELWPKQAPLAVRNFLQHCVDGYYDGTIFHRVVPGFIIQGGDPTGTGSGGEAAYGKPFRDEFHTRLKYTHRGIVSMAGGPKGADDNRSQFFITLDACPELNNINTIFGKIANDTIYNVLKIGEMATDSADRPLEPPTINEVIILSNPFDDIVGRNIQRAPAVAEAGEAGEGKAAKKKKKAKRKKKAMKTLLSFGGDDDDADVDVPGVTAGVVSSHDVGEDPTLSKEAATFASAEEVAASDRKTKSLQRLKALAAGKKPEDGAGGDDGAEASEDNGDSSGSKKAKRKRGDGDSGDDSGSGSGSGEEPGSKRTKVSSLAFKAGRRSSGGQGSRRNPDDLLTPLERRRQKYLKRGATKSADERLAKFRSGLAKANVSKKKDSGDWRTHTMKSEADFVPDDASLRKESDYVVIDPLANDRHASATAKSAKLSNDRSQRW